MKVLVVAPDPLWPVLYAEEAARLRAAAGEGVDLHHIGSTAIHGISAKPIIDLLMVVPRLASIDLKADALAALGYEALGEFGIPGRRYFRKTTAANVRTHHVHTFEADSFGARRHLAFRDYMNAHPDAAQAYSRLKQCLAQAFPHDIERYNDGNDAFIKEHEALALAWSADGTQRQSP